MRGDQNQDLPGEVVEQLGMHLLVLPCPDHVLGVYDNRILVDRVFGGDWFGRFERGFLEVTIHARNSSLR